MEGLPAELLISIVSRIPHATRTSRNVWDNVRSAGRDRRSLSSLCLTSKILRAISTPFLYESFVMLEGENGPCLRLFIRSIIERPELAAQLKYICYEKSLEASEQDDEDMEPDMPVYLRKVSTIPGLHDNDEFLDLLRNGSCEAQFVLLLCCTPKLEELVLRMPLEDKYDELFPLLSNALSQAAPAGNPPILSKLKRVTLESDPVACVSTFELSTAEILFTLPSLTRFIGYGAWIEDSAAAELWPDIRSKIQELYLNQCIMEEGVEHILGACDSLQIVEISFDIRHPPTLDLTAVSAALAQSQGTLETFFLDTSTHSMGSLNLSKFPKLKSIRVAVNDTVETAGEGTSSISGRIKEWLPASVESLELIWESDLFNAHEAKSLVQFVSICPFRFPCLESVSMVDELRDTFLDESDRTIVTSAFERVGIEFTG